MIDGEGAFVEDVSAVCVVTYQSKIALFASRFAGVMAKDIQYQSFCRRPLFAKSAISVTLFRMFSYERFLLCLSTYRNCRSRRGTYIQI